MHSSRGIGADVVRVQPRFLQRRMRLGYPKAARFIDMMEQDRVIGPGDGAKPREVLVGPEYLAKRGK